MKLDLADRVILVTGAASGIGKAIAIAAAQAGALVMLTDRDGDGLHRTATAVDGQAVVADLADLGAPQEIVEATLQAFGRIDGLVNAAGLTTRGGFDDATPDLWETLFAVNARAPFFLMQAAIADMAMRQAPGAIVNILSVNAHCGHADLSVYSATKGALATLTKNAAHAHLAQRIRANGIMLGWAETERETKMQTEVLGAGPDWAKAAARFLPLGRLIAPEEAARLTLFLLSDISAPMTGALIDLEQRVLGAPT